MNQERIGKFIAEQRKKKKLTQQELAEKLGISTNAVSKWERGICLMDMSLLKPLSEIFDVSVTELLNGELIKKDDILNKSENVIVELSKFYNFKSISYGIIGMCVIFIILLFISLFKDVSPSALVSMLCGYNATTFLSKYKFSKNKSDLTAGLLFIIATITNTIAFILC